MKSWLGVFVLLLFVSCTGRHSDTTASVLTEKQGSAAAFSIPNLADPSSEISLSAFKNQVVLLDFWATWCPPCRSELPALSALYEELKDDGFVLIGMTVDQGNAEKVAALVKPFNLTYPLGLAGGDVQKAYGGIRAVPTKILIDKEGAVRQRYVGVVSEEKLKKDIQTLLQE